MLVSRPRYVYIIHIQGDEQMKSREVIKKITAAGWYEVRQTGSHKHFRHPTKPGTATVPHPKSDMTIGTLKSISKQTGVSF